MIFDPLSQEFILATGQFYQASGEQLTRLDFYGGQPRIFEPNMEMRLLVSAFPGIKVNAYAIETANAGHESDTRQGNFVI